MQPVLLGDRVALVSGIGPGMGRAVALALAREGADVALAARTDRWLGPVAEEVEALGRRALPVPADIADPDECRRLADALGETFGRVDVLVNNAFAEDDFMAFAGFDPSTWPPVFDVNVFGTLGLTQAVVPLMREQGGSVVMISTISVEHVNPPFGAYASSKAALRTAVRQLALELGPRRIRVNSVAPAHVWGPSLEAYFAFLADRRGVTPGEVHDEIATQNALHRIHTPEEVARSVVFLASDLAAAVTGQTLHVNCGRFFN